MDTNALLVDLDGTVWDSYPWYALLLSQLRGIDPATVMRGLVDDGNIVGLLTGNGVSRPAFAQAGRAHGSSLRLYPGVRETLVELAARGQRIAAVTNLPGWLVDPMLDATDLRSSFEAVETRANKPHPRSVFELGRLLAVDLTPETYLVGDGERDCAAASAAGISFAWASYGYSRTPLTADVVIERFADLLRL